MKNIKNLYRKLQSDKTLLERLSGELTFKDDIIIWTYDLIKDAEEIEDCNDELEENDTEFADIVSAEELLNDAYETDLEEIEDTISAIDDLDDWYFSEPITNDTIISFNIH